MKQQPRRFRGSCLLTGKRLTGYYVQSYTGEDCIVCQNQLLPVKPDSITQFTGKTLCKGQEVFTGTIAFDEVEEDDGDIRTYFICVWIEEFGHYTWLTKAEWIIYQDMGVDSFDSLLIGTYNLEGSEKLHYAGEYFEKPYLLK